MENVGWETGHSGWKGVDDSILDPLALWKMPAGSLHTNLEF